jgi:iron complex outermembrane receptor protein
LPEFVAVPNPETDRSEQFSEEVRLTSTGDGALQWLGGLFLSNFHYLLAQNLTSPYFIDPIANPQGQLYVIRFPYDTKQYAAFAESSYQVTSKWKLTLGLRAFRYQSAVNATESGVFTPNGDATPFNDSIKTSNHGFTPKFNLAYIPTPDLTVYATASKGFRPGGISEPLPVSGPVSCLPSLQAIGFNANSVAYGPDSLWNFEVGEKARFLDRRLTIHSDVFYIRWNDIQQVVPLDCGYLLEANSGRARSYGPEIELTASLLQGLTLSINGAYTKAELSHPASFAGKSGQPLLNVPKYMGAAALIYTRPIGNGLTLNSRLSTSVTGPQWDIAYAPQELASFAITNFKIGIAGEHWSLALFANNVTNRMAIQTINNTSLSLNTPDLTRATVNQPRTIGLDLNYNLR